MLSLKSWGRCSEVEVNVRPNWGRFSSERGRRPGSSTGLGHSVFSFCWLILEMGLDLIHTFPQSKPRCFTPQSWAGPRVGGARCERWGAQGWTFSTELPGIGHRVVVGWVSISSSGASDPATRTRAGWPHADQRGRGPRLRLLARVSAPRGQLCVCIWDLLCWGNSWCLQCCWLTVLVVFTYNCLNVTWKVWRVL